MQALDHDVLTKKKSPSLSKAGPASAPKAPVPEAGTRLQQGQTADMQHNVGNSGLKDLLHDDKQKGPAKDPSRMTPDELRAQAKLDARQLAERQGPGKKKPNARADTAELDEKHKAHLDADAARKKREAEAAKAKAQDEAAQAARDKAKKPAAKAPELKKADPKPKARPGAAEAAQALAPAAKAAKGAEGHEPSKKEAHTVAKKQAAHAKVVQKDAEHEHAKTKADVGRSLAGKKQKEVTEQAKGAKAKLVETGRRAADKKVVAANAQKKVDEAAQHVKGAVGPTALKKQPEKDTLTEAKGRKPGAKAPKGKTAAPDAQTADKASTSVDPKKATLAAHQAKVDQLKDAHKQAEDKVAEQKVRKASAEVKVDQEAEVAKKASHAREAEQATQAEKAASEKVKKSAEAVDAIQAAKEKDKTIQEVSHAGDLADHDGEEITLVGVYVPRPAEGGGAHLGHVSIMVEGQEVRLGAEVRSTAELIRLAGEKVVVTGKLDLKKQAGQSLDPGRREKPILTGFRAPHRR